MLLRRIFSWFSSQPSPDSEMHNSDTFQQIHVQPCVINGKPVIVYQCGLKERSPCLFNQLSQYYTAQGYTLKEDQRTEQSNNLHRHERRRWAPIMVFTASLFFESNLYADVTLDYHNEAAPHQHQISLQMVPNKNIRNKISLQFSSPHKQASRQSAWQPHFKSILANDIFKILSGHYSHKESDPANIVEDLKEVANYYSDFPEVVSMLKKLDNKKWQLIFDKDNWVTVASGNLFQVDNAVIHFNLRAAAQLRLNRKCRQNPVCIASPADALLHELLHAYSMLINTEQFITQGGMSNVMYPYKHEYAVIESERKLYAMMTQQDKIKRPQRTDHVGRVVRVNCPTCIK